MHIMRYMRIGRRRVSVMILLLVLVFGLFPLVSFALSADEIQAQIQVILARISELQTILNTLGQSTPGSGGILAPVPLCVSFSRTLTVGARGDEMKDLQNFLISEGVLAEGNATGYFGPLTEAAVRAWQSAHGVVSSGDAASTGFGVVGPRTRAAMLTVCLSYQESSSALNVESASATSAPNFVPPIPPSIAVLSPRAGVAVAGGNLLRIAWQSTNTPSRTTVSISLLDNTNKQFSVIAQNVPPSGEYLWRVPQESTATGCPPGASAFDCIINITNCSGGASLCALPSGVYRIMATLSGGISATSASFQIVGGVLSDLLGALGPSESYSTSSDPSSSFATSSGTQSPSGVASGGCMHEDQAYEEGTTISVSCGTSSCPSTSSGTGFITAQCTGEKWCIPFTAYCASSVAAIDTSAYEGGGAQTGGYNIFLCPQEGYRAYLACPTGGCQSGWNTCRGGRWVRDTEQSAVAVGTQGPCQSGQVWCAIGTGFGYGCVPAAQCVNGRASI